MIGGGDGGSEVAMVISGVTVIGGGDGGSVVVMVINGGDGDQRW